MALDTTGYETYPGYPTTAGSGGVDYADVGYNYGPNKTYGDYYQNSVGGSPTDGNTAYPYYDYTKEQQYDQGYTQTNSPENMNPNYYQQQEPVYPGYDQQAYDQQMYTQEGGYDQQAYLQQGYEQQPQQEYLDQYGQPIQYDEQGNAYDYYGQLIQYDAYGQMIPQQQYYYDPQQNAAQEGYNNYDPYNVEGYQNAEVLPASYEPIQANPSQSTNNQQHIQSDGGATGQTELHVEAIVSQNQKKKKDKKKKSKRDKDKKKEVIVTALPPPHIPSAQPLTVHTPQIQGNKEIIVYPSQYPEWMASVVAANTLDAKKIVHMPTSVVHNTLPSLSSSNIPQQAQFVIKGGYPLSTVTKTPTSIFPQQQKNVTVTPAYPEKLNNTHIVTLSPQQHVLLPPQGVTTVNQIQNYPRPMSSLQQIPPNPHIPTQNNGAMTRYEVIPITYSPMGSSEGHTISGLQGVPTHTNRRHLFPCFNTNKKPTAIVRPFVQSIPSGTTFGYSQPKIVEISQEKSCLTQKPPPSTTVKFVNPQTHDTSTMKVIEHDSPPNTTIRKFNVVVDGKTTGSFVQKLTDPPLKTIKERRNHEQEIIHQIVKLMPDSTGRQSQCFRKNFTNKKQPSTPAEVFMVQSQIKQTPQLYHGTNTNNQHKLSHFKVIPEHPESNKFIPSTESLYVTSDQSQPTYIYDSVNTINPPMYSPMYTQNSINQSCPSLLSVEPQYQPQTIYMQPSVSTTIQPESTQMSSHPIQYVTSSPQYAIPSSTLYSQIPSTSITQYIVDQTQSPPPMTLIQSQPLHGAKPPSVVGRCTPMDNIQVKKISTQPKNISVAAVTRTSSTSEDFDTQSMASSFCFVDDTSINSTRKIELVADTVADENLKLQRDIAGLRRRLERTNAEDLEPSELTIAEQNAALRHQLRQLGKAVYDFSSKAPEDDGGAKLIEELSYQLNVAFDDLGRLQTRLNEKEKELILRETGSSETNNVKALLKKLIAEDNGSTGNINQQLFAEKRSNGHGLPEWYRSPVQADDIRHEMALVDDLIGQCQRIVAEATDQLWLVEHAVRDVLKKTFSALGLSGSEPLPNFKNESSRQQFLTELRDTADRHIEEVLNSRKDMDRIQEQIDTIKARAWDPKRNIPYCACRPRRDLLEDDVTHLMERLHEAGDQACQLRERLLGTELQNLTLQHEEGKKHSNRKNITFEDDNKYTAREQKKLQEKVAILESQWQRFMPDTDNPLIHRPLDKRHTVKEYDSIYPKKYPSLHERHIPPKKERVSRSSPVKPDAINDKFTARLNKNVLHTKRKAGREQSIDESASKKAQLREMLLAELEKHERTLLGLQQELHEHPEPITSEEWKGTKYRIINRMQRGGKELHELINKLEKNIQNEEDLALAYSISVDLKGLAQDVEKDIDINKLTNNERNLLKQVQQQAYGLLKTNIGLQQLGKNKWKDMG